MCLSMNSLRGATPGSKVLRPKCVCCWYGTIASWWILCHTGCITKKVRNRARPTMTWLGGDCCVPSAVSQKRQYDRKTGKTCHQNEGRGSKREYGQKENDLKHARYLLRPLGVIQVQIDGWKVESCRRRGNRMTDKDKGNKAKERKEERGGCGAADFCFHRGCSYILDRVGGSPPARHGECG